MWIQPSSYRLNEDRSRILLRQEDVCGFSIILGNELAKKVQPQELRKLCYRHDQIEYRPESPRIFLHVERVKGRRFGCGMGAIS
jgi:hypothetical protein